MTYLPPLLHKNLTPPNIVINSRNQQLDQFHLTAMLLTLWVKQPTKLSSEKHADSSKPKAINQEGYSLKEKNVTLPTCGYSEWLSSAQAAI